MDKPKQKGHEISKMEVMEAWKRVKANRGAAGIDDESIKDFEGNLKDNLYKIWNRMTSGSYFPPPVKTVEIPKADGGKRKLGIPTVGDRVAQMVAKIMEEMKVMIRDLPGRIDERGSDGGPLRRRRRMRRLHPMLFDKLMFVSEGEPDSMGLLIMASLIREDFPWMYEIGLEAYRMLNSGSIREAERLLSSLERSEKMLMGGLMEEYIDSPETEMMLHDSYHMLHHIIQRAIEAKKRTGKNLK